MTVERKLSPVQVHAGTMTASDALKLSSDAEASHTGDTLYTKAKEFYMRIPGTYRIAFDLKSSAAIAAYGRIYLNGAAHGTERGTVSTTYVNFSEDLRVDDGDLLQLYLRIVNAAQTVFARNFRLYGTVAIGAGVENAV